MTKAPEHCRDYLVSCVLCCFNNLASISLALFSDEAVDIIFDSKAFYDTGQIATGDGVSISGTLTGEGVGTKNNTVTVTCYQDRMECLTYSIVHP